MKNKHVLTIGQFSKLLHINPRTLHYYDEIGLFQPTIKGENGYRYYSYPQLFDLELILAFRDLGMSIPEIKTTIQSDVNTINQLYTMKINEIDLRIKQLETRKKQLQMKRQLLSQSIDFGTIESIICEESHLTLSEMITDNNYDTSFHVLKNLMDKQNGARIFNQEYGIMMSEASLKKGTFDQYDYFYTKAKSKNKHNFIRPKGTYLRIVVKGSWEQLPHTYQQLVTYAKNKHLQLIGYAYERSLNETLSTNMNEYITEIMIQYK